MAILSSDKKSVTVQKGDTLSEIAEKYAGGASKYKYLAKINDIDNPNLIYVGQVIKLTATSSSSKTTATQKKTSSSSNKAVIKSFGLQSDTDRTVFATWTWGKSHTDNYKVRWYYSTGDGVWFVGEDGTEEFKQSVYNAPENATRVKFIVKPVATKRKVNNKETAYWTAKWSTEKIYSFSNNPPATPPIPTVELDGLTLKMRVDNLDVNATHIQFQVVKNDDPKKSVKTKNIPIKTNSASTTHKVSAGNKYKVRCRAVKKKEYSDWSEYSGNFETRPSAPKEIIKIKALSETSVYLDWSNVSIAESYDVEYTTKKSYFDSSNSVSSMSVDAVVGHAEVTGLETGNTYFFRVRAVKGDQKSGWSPIASITIGKAPAAPTTWSSSTTAITTDPLTLYWIHNSEDGSTQELAQLQLKWDGTAVNYSITTPGRYKIDKSNALILVEKFTTDEDKVKTNSVEIDISNRVEGAKLTWKVKTAGVTKVYGDWSVERTVDIYAPPVLDLRLTDKDDDDIETIEQFPFYIYGIASPATQSPIGYSLSIIANETYETIDQVGNNVTVSAGSEVYSEYFDTTGALLAELSAGNIDLENNVQYTVTCVVSMDSGLTAEASLDFNVSWADAEYEPNAEIAVDEDTYSAIIRPYCEHYPPVYYKVEYDSTTGNYTVTAETIDEIEGMSVVDDATADYVYTTEDDIVFLGTNADGEEVYFCIRDPEEATLVEDMTLSVYRREFDGSFTELATGIDHTAGTFVTDPHPALDYARYRIVAITTSTGAVSYSDVPAYPIGEKAIIIQWDEEWTNFDNDNEDALEQPPWSGSLLRLPYNIDVSDKYNPDVSLVDYIGREHPVAYYGTQLGVTSTWSADIDKKDEETLYALRRLSRYMGDVYVREPSGSGYWANIKVSFGQKHKDLTIPVTLDITRVEGGV